MKRRSVNPSTSFGDRPEKSGRAELHYDDQEAERYTTVGATIGVQRDLTRRALALLEAHRQCCQHDQNFLKTTGIPPVRVLLDLGSGSGLSRSALGLGLGNTNLAWIGMDISSSMLRIAAQQPECEGRILLSDMSQGVCLRPGCLDGAISISAVQWLCVHDNPHRALDALFSSLRMSLRDSCGAVFQVYLENNEQGELLLRAAHANGFHAGLFIDFPHAHGSKKQFLCCQKSVQGENLSPRPCNLAWPAGGCCALGWLYWNRRLTRKCDRNFSPEVLKIEARLRQEHSQIGKKALRLLARCCNPGQLQVDSATASDEMVVLEFGGDAPDRAMVPCGGPLAFRLSIPKSILSDSSKTTEDAVIAVACGTCLSEDLHVHRSISFGDMAKWDELLNPSRRDELTKNCTPYYSIQLIEVTRPTKLEKYSPRFAILHAEKHPAYVVAALELPGHNSFPTMREDVGRFCTEFGICVVGFDVAMTNDGGSCACILYVGNLEDFPLYSDITSK